MGTMAGLRVALSDRPGALMKVAATIAEHGGNIVSIDVHRAGFSQVIDDLIIDFPDDGDLDRLRHELTANGAGMVVSHWSTQPVDPVVAALGYVAGLLAQHDDGSEDGLARVVGQLCGTPVAWVTPATDADRYEAGRFAKERGGAIALRTTELPADLADRLPGEVWLLAVPDAGAGFTGRVVFVARPLANEFTTTEIARVEALLTLYEQLQARAR
jgi:predicted amino acid-binding ACT domain protein